MMLSQMHPQGLSFAGVSFSAIIYALQAQNYCIVILSVACDTEKFFKNKTSFLSFGGCGIGMEASMFPNSRFLQMQL